MTEIKTETTKETTTAPKKGNKKIWLYAMIIVLLVGVSIPVFQVVMKNASYNKAVAALEAKDYATAINGFQELGDYKDSPEQLKEAKYQKATAALEEQDYTIAIVNFEELEDYKDSAAQLTEAKYEKYVKDVSSGIYDTSPGIGDYKDVLKYQAYAKGMKQWDFTNDCGSYRAIQYFREASGILDADEKANALAADMKWLVGTWKGKTYDQNVSAYYSIKENGTLINSFGDVPASSDDYDFYYLTKLHLNKDNADYINKKHGKNMHVSGGDGIVCFLVNYSHDNSDIKKLIDDSNELILPMAKNSGFTTIRFDSYKHFEAMYTKAKSTPVPDKNDIDLTK